MKIKLLIIQYHLGYGPSNETLHSKHPCLNDPENACCYLLDAIFQENKTQTILNLMKFSLELTDSNSFYSFYDRQSPYIFAHNSLHVPIENMINGFEANQTSSNNLRYVKKLT